MSNLHFISATKQWVEQTVIALNLCPFAKREVVRGSIHYALSAAESLDRLVEDLISELQRLTKEESIETTLLIHPYVLTDFIAYNHFLEISDQVLVQLGLEGVIQIASFHPDYQFADAEPQAIENFTNRSPFPMLHLLREESVEKAIAQYPNTEAIPQRNVETLQALSKLQKVNLLKLAQPSKDPQER